MQRKLLGIIILVLSAAIGLSVLENSASAARVINWQMTNGDGPRMFCNFNPSGIITTTETSRTRAATGQVYDAIVGSLFKWWLFNCYFFTDGEFYIFRACSGGTWLVWCGWLAGEGTWDVTVILPTVSVTASPPSVTTTWQNWDAQASVSCTQSAGACDPVSYRLLFYSSSPGTCPTDYNSYPISPPQTISSHAWVCAAAKDTAGDVGFSPSPVEFKVDKIPPGGSILIDNGAEYTTSESVTLNLAYSDTGGSLIHAQGCRYSNDGIWDSEPWEVCNPTKSWTLTPGPALKTVYFEVRDNAGNTFQASDTITLLSGSECEASEGLYCCVRNGACQAGEVDVFHMSDRINAHAELRTQANYGWAMCCGGVAGMGAGCSGIYDTVIKLFSQTNSHVEYSTLLNYNYLACLNITEGTVDCNYPAPGQDCTALGADYVCVAKLSADTNAHVSDCEDPNYNRRACCKVLPAPCVMTSATITANCAGGSSPDCEVGETIKISGRYTGDCSDANFFQIDAAGAGCTIRYSGGDLSGIWNGSGLINSGGYINGTWSIDSIPLTCSGRIVSASMGFFYENGPPPLNLITSAAASGSFKFKDIIPPTTTINPNGASWTNSDIPFTLTCIDDTAGSGCKTTYYKAIDAIQTCTAGGFSPAIPPLSVTCPPNTVCERRVCYYSDDNAGNVEAIKTSNVFQIDRTVPINVDVTHVPPNPTDENLINFTATASDTGSALEIFIYVEEVVGSGSYILIGSCFGSTCPILYQGPYSPGIHRYYATATDEAGNSAPSPIKQFTVTGCILWIANIKLNDANGNNLADSWETISMSGMTTGNCSRADFFQTDASGGSCTIEFTGGDMSGISNGSGLNISGGYVNGTWTIPFLNPSIPDCSSQTVTATAAAIYDGGPPGGGIIIGNIILPPGVTGSFRFNDYLSPATIINPDGNFPSWSNQNISFQLTCTDEVGGSGCHSTLYKIIDSSASCTPGGFTSGTPPINAEVGCNPGFVCKNRVCYYSNDSAGNIELTQTSNIFQIDKQNPTASLAAMSPWTRQILIPVSWSGSDFSGSGVSNYTIQNNESWADGTPVSGWTDWLYETTSLSDYFPGQDNHTYFFKVRASDRAGNVGPYSAEVGISVDTELPNITYTLNAENNIFNLSSVAWDSISGIFNHTISCIVINPSGSEFVQCESASPFGGISDNKIAGGPCETGNINYNTNTEISCDIRAEDRAGNIYSTNIFFTLNPEYSIMKLHEHNVFISIGETYHARIDITNIKPLSDMINVSMAGTYPSGFAKFLLSSPIIYNSADWRNITVLLNPYERKIVYAEIRSTDAGEYTLDFEAGSQNYPLEKSDQMSILIGLPASFTGIELLSIAAIISIAGLAYFRYLRRLK